MTQAPRWFLPKHSIRTQLIWWNTLTLALILVVLGVLFQFILQTFLIKSVDRELFYRTQSHVQGLPPEQPQGPPPGQPGGLYPQPVQNAPPGPPQSMAPGTPQGTPRPTPPVGEAMRGRFADLYRPRLIGLDGRSLRPDGAPGPWDLKSFQESLRGQQVYITVMVDGEPLRIISRPFPERGPVHGVVQAPYPLTEIYRAISTINRVLLWLIPIALLSAGIGAALVTNRAVRPVEQMTQTAGQIEVQDLSRRLAVIGEDEFAHLAITFNRMLERLEQAFAEQSHLLEQQKRFTADASHELQTPLAVIKANTSLSLSSEPTREECLLALKDIDEAATAMSKLVQDLLLLARSDAGRLGGNRVALPLREVLERAIARVKHVESAPIKLCMESDSLFVEASEDELLRLFVNLLENAQRYTPIVGMITVTAGSNGSHALVSVADTGVGIAPEHLPRLGERFYRVESSRSRPGGGTGLGLSICRSIVQAHGGQMEIESTLGKGTTVKIALPISQDAG